MSSRLTTDDELVAWAAHLPGSEWRRLTNTVAWLHRRRDMTERDVPAELRALHETVLDRDSWRSVCRGIAKERRALYRLRVKEKKEAGILRRRAYMREYMARRRKGQ